MRGNKKFLSHLQYLEIILSTTSVVTVPQKRSTASLDKKIPGSAGAYGRCVVSFLPRKNQCCTHLCFQMPFSAVPEIPRFFNYLRYLSFSDQVMVPKDSVSVTITSKETAHKSPTEQSTHPTKEFPQLSPVAAQHMLSVPRQGKILTPKPQGMPLQQAQGVDVRRHRHSSGAH